jgi:hypothetical protein
VRLDARVGFAGVFACVVGRRVGGIGPGFLRWVV